MPSQPYHHPDLRDRLIQHTRALVEGEGADAVTIARVAAACGVSVAAPYRHFRDKSALLGAVAGEGFADLGTAVAAAAGLVAEPRDRLVEAGVAYVAFATTHPHLFRLMFNAELRDPQDTAGPAALAGLAELLTPLPLAVPADAALRTTWALAHGHAALRVGGMRTFTDADSLGLLRTDLRVLLDGILSPEP